MPLRERVHTDATAEATPAPDQEGTPAGNRQIPHPHQRALLHLATPLPATRAATTGRDELDLEVELVTPLRDRRHDQPLESEEPAKLLVHPLFLPAPRSMTTQKLARTADVSSYALNPARSARPHKCSMPDAVATRRPRAVVTSRGRPAGREWPRASGRAISCCSHRHDLR